MKEIDLKKYIVRVLVEVTYYITDEDGNCIVSKIEEVETDSGSISNVPNFLLGRHSVAIKAKEIRLYGNTSSPIYLKETINLTNTDD